jgi:tRNA dimethylallyltransferase
VVCKIFVIFGPTASGKSDVATELALQTNGVVINADALQIYQGLPILSNQPDSSTQKIVDHRLYGLLAPNDNCNLGRWLQLVSREIRQVQAQQKSPIVIGGTGLYISRLINGLRPIPSTDPVQQEKMLTHYRQLGPEKFFKKIGIPNLFPSQSHPQKIIRLCEIYLKTGITPAELVTIPNREIFPRQDFFVITLQPSREFIYDKCHRRFESILERALEEVKDFHQNYPNIIDGNYHIKHTFGFLEISRYLKGQLDRDSLLQLTVRTIRNYAKRQYTWLRHQLGQIDFSCATVPNKENIPKIVEKIITIHETL